MFPSHVSHILELLIGWWAEIVCIKVLWRHVYAGHAVAHAECYAGAQEDEEDDDLGVELWHGCCGSVV